MIVNSDANQKQTDNKSCPQWRISWIRNENYSITEITNLKTSAGDRHCGQPGTLVAITLTLRVRTYLIFIFLFTIFLERSDACSCRNVTKRFFDHLSTYQFVGLVEIIGIDTIKDHDYDMAFTIVRVLKEYHDNKTLDTLYIPEGDGGSCNVSIKNRGVGNRFILKGYLNNKSDWEANWEDFQKDIKVAKNPEKTLVLSLCDENTLCMKDSTVIGNITRNNEIKRANTYVGLPQEMDIIKVERLLRRHL